MDQGRKWLVDFNAGKTQLVLFDQSSNIGAIGVKMDGSVLEEESSFKMLGLTFSSTLDWGSYIRDHHLIPFVMLNGFCPLSNPHPTVLRGQYQDE